MMRVALGILAVVLAADFASGGILQPRASKTRETSSLDGLWYFTTKAELVDSIEEADDVEVNLMPVPSSYNDISTQIKVRDHVGPVWYKRNFYVSSLWISKKVWIRFGSVCYNASVSINGETVTTHYIGHLPFAAEITQHLNFGRKNTILVEVNNILTSTSIPQGTLGTLPSGTVKQYYSFDFFHYAGIDRPVVLFTTNDVYVDDININTEINGTAGVVKYEVVLAGADSSTKVAVNVLDKQGNIVATSQDTTGILSVENANLWWPFQMHPKPGYLYTMKVVVKQIDRLVDHYKQPFGIRYLEWNNANFTINGKNIYIRGFGRHEDSDFRGRGVDLPLIIRDHNLIKWIGANCYRTSHYPYAEEIMDLADQLGIMIIDEVPAVNVEDFNDELLENHKRSLTELYLRDKNRPSVVLWSIANEPRSQQSGAQEYFRRIAAHIKSFDKSRPLTSAISSSAGEDQAGQFLDIVGFNRYEAWYSNVGEVDSIYPRLLDWARDFHNKHNKPVIITEYGADAQEGLSFLPTYIWSEEYQNDMLVEHFKAFDTLREEGWFVGEMIWNFADFKTDQDYLRVGVNKKGLFTRNRQPKRSAFLMRKRYWALANLLDNASLPSDLEPYIAKSVSKSYTISKGEL